MSYDIEKARPLCNRCNRPLDWDPETLEYSHECEVEEEGWHYVDRKGPFPLGCLIALVLGSAVWIALVWIVIAGLR